MIRKLANIQGEDVGVFAISLVDKPANKAQFKNPCKSGLCSLSENNEVVGLILRPEQDILRVDEEGEEYNMFFDSNAVKLAQESFTKNLALLNSNLQHEQKAQEGVSFVESWIVEDKESDKSNLYGFVPKMGEWYVKAKIENKEVLKALEDGSVNGFSLEGEFSLTESEGSNFSSMSFIEKLKVLLADEEKPEEKTEEKMASIEEIAAIVEELVKQVAALMPQEPTEEEMKAEEDLAEDDKKKEEEMQAQLTELKEANVKMVEQIKQIPVDLPTMRQALELSEESKQGLEAKKYEALSIQGKVNYNLNKNK